MGSQKTQAAQPPWCGGFCWPCCIDAFAGGSATDLGAEIVEEEATAASVSQRPGQVSERVEVWEFQRRRSLTAGAWRAPFLPLDGIKRWRWLCLTTDLRPHFVLHPWNFCSLSASNKADRPPLSLPQGWKLQAEWAVVALEGEADDSAESGWLYGSSAELGSVRPLRFLGKKAASTCHMRRRKWAATVVREDEDAEPIGLPQGASIKALRRRTRKEADKKQKEERSSACSRETERTTAGTILSTASSTEEVVAFESGTLDFWHSNTNWTTTLQDRVRGLDMKKETASLMSEDWGSGNIAFDLLENRGAPEIRLGPWSDGTKGFKVRNCTAEVPLPPRPFSPRWAHMQIVFRMSVSKDPASGYTTAVLGSSNRVPNVPSGDSFTQHGKIILEEKEGEVAVTKVYSIEWHKSCVIQSLIDQNTAEQEAKAAEVLLSLLQKRAVAGVQEQVVELWELQRRVSVLAMWQPPFLPHDGVKRLRWVTLYYERHDWCPKGQLADSNLALSSVPILCPPAGWELDASGWRLACRDAEMNGDSSPKANVRRSPNVSSAGVLTSVDLEGWQYSLEFTRVADHYSSSPGIRSCRRRLWRGVFVKASSREEVDLGVEDEPSSAEEAVCCLFLPKNCLAPA